jgi:hypothetical protein
VLVDASLNIILIFFLPKCIVSFRSDHFRFGLVFIKKKTKILKKAKTEPKSVQTDRFRFGFLGQKPIQTGLARFGSVFFCLARFYLIFSVLGL